MYSCRVEFVKKKIMALGEYCAHFFCCFIAMDKERFLVYTLMKLLLDLKL